MLRVSVDRQAAQPAEEVVLYDGDIPIAVAMLQGGAVFFCDAIRDPNDFAAALDVLGVKYDKSKLHVDGGDLKDIIS